MPSGPLLSFRATTPSATQNASRKKSSSNRDIDAIINNVQKANQKRSRKRGASVYVVNSQQNGGLQENSSSEKPTHPTTAPRKRADSTLSRHSALSGSSRSSNHKTELDSSFDDLCANPLPADVSTITMPTGSTHPSPIPTKMYSSPQRSSSSLKILTDLEVQKQEVMKYLDTHTNFHAEVRQKLGESTIALSEKISMSRLVASVRSSFVNTRHDSGTKMSDEMVEQEASPLLRPGDGFSMSSTDGGTHGPSTTLSHHSTSDMDLLDHSHYHLNVEYGTNIDSFDALWEEYKASVIERKMHNVTKMQGALQQLNTFRTLLVNSSATSHELTSIKEYNDDLRDMVEQLKTNMERIAFDEEKYQEKVHLWKIHAAEKDKLLLSTLKREENRVHQLRDLLLSRQVMESRKWDHLNLMFKICNDYNYNPDTIYRCFLCTEKLYHFYYHRLHEWKQFRFSLSADQLSEKQLDQFLSNTSDVQHEETYLKKYHMQQLLEAIRNDARSEMAKHLKKNFDKSSFDEYSHEIKDNSQKFDIGQREEESLYKKYNRVDIGVQYTFRDRAGEKQQRELKEKLEYTTKTLEQKERRILERAQEVQDRLARNLSDNTKPVQCGTGIGGNVVESASAEVQCDIGVGDSLDEKSVTQDKSKNYNQSEEHSSNSLPSGLVVKPIEYSHTKRAPRDSAESPHVMSPEDTITDRLSRRASWKITAQSADEHLFSDLQNEIMRLTEKLTHYETDATLEERKQIYRLQQDVKYLRDRLRMHEGRGHTPFETMASHNLLFADSASQTTAIDTGITQMQATDDDIASSTNVDVDLLTRASTQLNLLQNMDFRAPINPTIDLTTSDSQSQHRTVFSEINGLPARKHHGQPVDVQTPVSINPHEIYYLQDKLTMQSVPGVFKSVQVYSSDVELGPNTREKLVQTKIKGVPESKSKRKQEEAQDSVGPVALVMVEVEHLSDIFASDDEVASRSLEMYNTIVQNLISKYEGTCIKQYHATGGYVCAFPKVVEGVNFTLSLLKKLNNTSWPPDLMYVHRCRVIKDDKQGCTLLRGFRVSASVISSTHSILGKDLVSKAEHSLMESLRQLLLLNKKAQGGLIVVSNDVFAEIKLNMFLANELYVSKSLKSNLRELQVIAPLRVILPHKLQGRHELVLKKQQKGKMTHTSKMLKKSREAGYREKVQEAVSALNAMNKKDKKSIENGFVDRLMKVRNKNHNLSQAPQMSTPSSVKITLDKEAESENEEEIQKAVAQSVGFLQRLEEELDRERVNQKTYNSGSNVKMLEECRQQMSLLLQHLGRGESSLLDTPSCARDGVNGCIDLTSYHHRTPKLLSLSKRMGYTPPATGGMALGMLSSGAAHVPHNATSLEDGAKSQTRDSRRRPSTAAVDPRHIRKLHM
mmetsp:Transcript_4954/g.18634  ORF Transcript_4954/g.18634 Transcript_4954/m.18634 type:complete len:1391 (-) Transcript_4954:6118-10290(-)